MGKKMKKDISRRSFIKTTSLGSVGLASGVVMLPSSASPMGILWAQMIESILPSKV